MVNDSFRALSHPLRREIVERLAAGPATVGEVTRGFEVSKPAISKHLKVLEETGVVTRVVEGSRSSRRRSARPPSGWIASASSGSACSMSSTST
jgi:DNA-binding transcriptional ArsR family regulator